jgi:hypothetical protein
VDIKFSKRTYHDGKVFVVGDVLHQSNQNTPSVLIVKFVRLSRSCPVQVFGDAIMLPKPNGMQESQQWMLIHPEITCE